MARLAIIGVGRIGGEVAYLASAQGIADELVLHDSAQDLLQAQVLDLKHTGLDIDNQHGYPRYQGRRCLHLLCRPAPQPVGEDPGRPARSQPAGNRAKLLPCLHGFSGILITVTNPMDINNYYLCTKTGIPRERCIGFGGQLDSARFGFALRNRNMSGVPVRPGRTWRAPGPALLPASATRCRIQQREDILSELRGASMEVIKGKGGTVFGPALHLDPACRDGPHEYPGNCTVCSVVLEGEYGITGCSLGVPVVIGNEGIRKIEEWPLDAWEQKKMDEAGRFAQELCRRAVN